MKTKFYGIFIFILSVFYSKSSANEISNTIFEPLQANIYEGRIGTVFTNTDKKLRLDIGGNYDFWQDELSNSAVLGTGVEFFTYTRLRSEGKLKFPVETTDFYFGLNGSYKLDADAFQLESRLRIGHISTHLSDGFSSNSTFYQEPFVYSKEFFDWVVAVRKWNFRPYLGAIFNFSKQPKVLNFFVPQLGIEYSANLYKQIDFVAAYDFKLSGYDGIYLGMNTISTGIEFRTASNRGILLKFDYYSGENYYGQFYKEKLDYFGIGFEFKYN